MLGLLALLRGCAADWGEPERDGLVVLTAQNFERFVRGNQYVAVLFTDRVCEECVQVAPVFRRLAGRFRAGEHPVAFAEVDVGAEEALMESNSISFYPVVKLFTRGRFELFPYLITEERLLAFLHKRVHALSPLLEADNEFDELELHPVSFLLVLPEGDAAALEVFHNVLRDFDDVPAAHSHDYARVPDYKGKSRYVLKVFRLFDDGNRIFATNQLREESLRAFVAKVRHPDVVYLDQTSLERVFAQNTTSVLLFVKDPRAPELAPFKQVAERLKGRALFGVVYLGYGVGERLAGLMGVGGEEHGALRILSLAREQVRRFVCPEVSAAALTECLRAFEADELRSYPRTEPLPPAGGPLRVVVGRNFAEEVLNSPHPVILLWHPSFCEDCARLLALHTALAQRLAALPDIVVARMDATLNEAEQLAKTEPPALLLFRAGSHEQLSLPADLSELLSALEARLARRFDAPAATEL